MRAMQSKPNESGASRLDATFRAEELAGLKLATQVRVAALAAVAFLILQSADIKYVNIAVLAAFAAFGIANYRLALARGGQGWFSYLFFALDVTLLTVVLLVVNPAINVDGMTAPLMLRLGNFVFYSLFVALAALSYSPGLMIWAGVASALAWGLGYVYVLVLPDTLTFADFTEPAGGWTLEAAVPLLGNPHFIGLTGLSGELILIVIVAGILAVVVWRARRLVVRQAAAARERSNLARYFPPSMVERLATSDEVLGEVRRAAVTVLFADIVGFTRLAERATPEATIALLREFHARMERVVFEHGGTLDKFLGDGLMATFGTPVAGQRDAADALACGRAMLAAVAAWNADRAAAGDPAVRLSVGLHSGEAVLGDIGSERRLEFAVVGDVVNVGSRIEALTRPLDAALLVSDAVVAAARGASDATSLLADMAALAPQAVRGRGEQVVLWRLERAGRPVNDRRRACVLGFAPELVQGGGSCGPGAAFWPRWAPSRRCWRRPPRSPWTPPTSPNRRAVCRPFSAPASAPSATRWRSCRVRRCCAGRSIYAPAPVSSGG